MVLTKNKSIHVNGGGDGVKESGIGSPGSVVTYVLGNLVSQGIWNFL